MTAAQQSITVPCGPRTGTVSIPASKSRAHRLLICAALSRNETEILCRGISKDILATVSCIRAMGAEIEYEEKSSLFRIRKSLLRRKTSAVPLLLPCGESGSTLRFLLPVAGALGLTAVFQMEGRLPERPMAPLTGVLTAHGMHIRQEGNLLYCEGQLQPGDFSIPGNISSQYVSGLLFALPLLRGTSTLRVTDSVESSDYIAMTEDALRLSGFTFENRDYSYVIPGSQEGSLPSSLAVESDWSSAAFFLCLGALSPEGVRVTGMNPESVQGDRAVLRLLEGFGAQVSIDGNTVAVRSAPLHGQSIDAAAIPDLVPVLSVVAAAAGGETVIHHAGRLRLKESDRLKTTAAMLSALGADIQETEDGLIIRGASGGFPSLSGGTVSSFLDHRIAMSAAVAASVCRRPVTVTDPLCTEKSFPGFWETLLNLDCIGGNL